MILTSLILCSQQIRFHKKNPQSWGPNRIIKFVGYFSTLNYLHQKYVLNPLQQIRIRTRGFQAVEYKYVKKFASSFNLMHTFQSQLADTTAADSLVPLIFLRNSCEIGLTMCVAILIIALIFSGEKNTDGKRNMFSDIVQFRVGSVSIHPDMVK